MHLRGRNRDPPRWNKYRVTDKENRTINDTPRMDTTPSFLLAQTSFRVTSGTDASSTWVNAMQDSSGAHKYPRNVSTSSCATNSAMPGSPVIR